MSDLVGRLAEKWLDEQGDDIEPAYDRNRTDSKMATQWWLNAIAEETEEQGKGQPLAHMWRWNDVARWLRSQAQESP